MPTAKIRRAARIAASPARILPFLPLLIAVVALVATALAAPAPLGAQDPQPGLVFTPAGGSPAAGSAEVGYMEGRAWYYSVALNTQPTGTVTVRIRSSSRSVVITRNQQLSFDADNWNTAQDVGYRSQEGSGGSTATLTHTASGGGYENITGTASVTINSVPKFAEQNGITRRGNRIGYGYSYQTSAQFLTVGEPFRLTLPPAIDGDGALSHHLSMTDNSGNWCYQPPPSHSGVNTNAPNPGVGAFIDFIGLHLNPDADRIPNWMSYTPPGPGDRHGGVISGTPNVAMRPYCFTLWVSDSDSFRSSEDRTRLHFQIRVNAPSSDGRLAIKHTMRKQDGATETTGSYRIRLHPDQPRLAEGETVSVSFASDNPDITINPTATTFRYAPESESSPHGYLPETIYVGVSAAHDADSLPDPARITHTVTRTGRGTQTFSGIVTVVGNDPPDNAGGGGATLPTPTRITPAAVTQLHFYGSPRSGSAYTEQERILIMVEFDRPVTATGKVYLDLQVGEQLRRAYYFRSTDPRQLRFHYRVQLDDYDAVGVSVPAGTITLDSPAYNGDSIRDANNVAANLAHHGIAADANHKVHGSAAPQVTPTPTPTPGPMPTRLAPAAVTQLYFYGSPRRDSTYGDRNRERILIMVEFDRAVTVTGEPYLDLHIGDQKRRATYFRSVNPHQLRFHYRVQPDDFDTDGVSVPAGAINLNEGSIRGAYGVAANLAHHGIAADATRKVQGSAARVAPTRRAPAAITLLYYPSYYKSPRPGVPYGDRARIYIMAEFDRAVTVIGQPYVDLQIGEQLRRATYFRGGNTPLLQFQYRVQADDYDADGISVPAGPIRLNGGSIQDADGVAANLAHHGLAASANRMVHGSAAVPPTPTPTPTLAASPSPTLTPTPSPTPHGPAQIARVYHHGTPRDGHAYADRERILITVSFYCCRYVTVTGEPYLDLQVGDQLRRATFFRGTNTGYLRFHYRVQPDDYDADGVSVPAGVINLNGGSIRVVDGSEFDLTHRGIATDPAHKVQGSAAVQLTPTRTPTPTPEPTRTPTPTPELAPTPTPTGPAAPALTINPARLNLSESAYATYTVALAAPPAGADAVTVSIAAQRTAPADTANIGADNGGVTISPSTLTFTSRDWATPQTVTVTAGPDDNVTNDTVILTHTAAGGNYAGIIGRLTASVADAGIGNSYTVNGHTVTVERANDAPAGISVVLPSTLAAATTVTIAMPDNSVPLSSNDYNLGGDVAGLTVAQIAVAPAPSDGATVCLPVRDALRRSADAARASLSLLRYHNGAWTPAAGSDDRTTQVCLESVTDFGAFALGYYAPASPPAPTFPLGMPSNLSAYAGAKPGTVVLSWTPGANSDTHFISGYKAAELNDGNAGVAIWEMASGRSSHILTGLKRGTEYVITISAGRVVDGVTEWSSWSDSWVTVTPNYEVR